MFHCILALVQPVVSIILPVKNAGNFIDECLESVRNQTYQQWECMIIDDDSTDNSIKTAYMHGFYDDRIRIVKNEESGLTGAYRTGLNHSRGDLITRMDADDIMVKTRLEKMVQLMKKAMPKTVITGMVRFFPSENLGPGTLFYEHWLNERMLNSDHWENIWRECVIPSPAWMARKAELEEIGGFGSLEYPEDYDLAFRFYSQGFQVLAIREVIHLWRQHDRRYSRISDHYSAENFMKMRWHLFKKLKLNHRTPLLLGSGDKAKILMRILDDDAVDYTLLNPKFNPAHKTTNGKPLIWYQNHQFTPDQVVISTLSSIDNHAEIFDYLRTQNAEFYRFC